ncbi:FUSC family protein [Paenochrobactrum pullorum]|uniref:FUSC family protein n=1 Tax=Paenochrobactrum pullorum TaxID=1324351 RepID=UPI0035BBBC61
MIQNFETKVEMQKRWFHQLLALSPAYWPLRQSIRSAITIAGPILLGIVLNNAGNFMMMSLCALGLALGEKNTSYILRLKEVFIITFIGATGFFMGYVTGFSWELVIVVMMLATFCAGIIGSFSAALSAAMTQALLMATIAIAMPNIAPFWQPALFFIAGGVFYAALLSLDALLFHKLRFKKSIAKLLEAIAILAEARSKNVSEAEENTYRRLIHKQFSSAYNSLLIKRYYRRVMYDHYLEWQTAILEDLEAISNSTLAAKIPENLAEMAKVLRELSKEIQDNKISVIGEKNNLSNDMFLTPIVTTFIESYNHQNSTAVPNVMIGKSVEHKPSKKLSDVISGQDIKSAVILALCIGIAFCTKWVNSNSHWYWTPLTVIIVLKPDLGSIFTRSILRIFGTILGVCLGVIIFIFIPKGMLLVCILAALASCMPWASQRSYWMSTFIATPIVLMLLDLINPNIHNVDYGLQRMLDTLVGGAIILIFGYFLWPREHREEFDKNFHEVRNAIATYLLTLRQPSTAEHGDKQLLASSTPIHLWLLCVKSYVFKCRNRHQLELKLQHGFRVSQVQSAFVTMSVHGQPEIRSLQIRLNVLQHLLQRSQEITKRL